MYCEDLVIVFMLCVLLTTSLLTLYRGKWDYELYLSFDLYTVKHTQWFYFSVKNMRKGQTYRFTIVNLYKVSLGLCELCITNH